MKITGSGTLIRANDIAKQMIAFIPSICRLANGELIVGFQFGKHKHHAHGTVLVCRSMDGGQTWSNPEAPFASWAQSIGMAVHAVHMTELAPDRLVANLMIGDHKGDPEIQLFNPVTGGAVPIHIGLAESNDGGKTWSAPVLLDTGALRDTPTPIMGPIVKAPNGELLLPFETSKPYDDPGNWMHNAACFVSRDNGVSWGEVRIIAHDPTNSLLYWDHRLTAVDGGRCVDFFYTFDNTTGQQTTAYKSVSLDGGSTWPQKPVDTGLVGQPWPVALSGDDIVVLSVDRFNDAAIKAHFSSDLGDTWQDEVTVFQGPRNSFASSSFVDSIEDQLRWSYGLPSGVKTGDREVTAVWYAGLNDDPRIEWATIEV